LAGVEQLYIGNLLTVVLHFTYLLQLHVLFSHLKDQSDWFWEGPLLESTLQDDMLKCG